MFLTKTASGPHLLQQNPYFLPLPQGQGESDFQGMKITMDTLWESVSYRVREVQKDAKTRNPSSKRASNLFDSISSRLGSLMECITLPFPSHMWSTDDRLHYRLLVLIYCCPFQDECAMSLDSCSVVETSMKGLVRGRPFFHV